MKTGIHVGATRKAIKAYEKAVLKILSQPHCDEQTKQVALRTLQKGVEVKHTTVSHCIVTGT